MRKGIVVLGFFIIALILIAGCTSAQNSATAGSKNQNPSGNTNVKMTSAEPKAAPTWSYATKGPINSVAISADGQYVAAGSGDGNGNMIYYFSRDGKQLWNYSSEFCTVIGVSSDGQKAIISDDDQNIIYFSRDGKRLLEYPEGNENYHYAISADGQYVFASGLSNENRCSKYAGKRDSQGRVIMCSIPPLINLYGDKLLWSKEVEAEMADVAMSADGQYMATGKNKVYYFSRNGNPLWSKEVEAGMADVAMSADGQYIVTGTPRGGVYYFSQDGKLLWNYTTKNAISSVDVSADGQYVVVGTDGVGDVYYFSREGKLLWNQTTASGDNFVDMSADGQYVVARTFAKVYYFSHEGKLLWSQYAGSDSLTIANSIAISADGRNVIVGSHERYGDSKVYFFSRD